MATVTEPPQRWVTYEVVERDAAGGGGSNRPVSAALAGGGVIPPQPLTKMKVVERIGWPDALRQLKDGRGKRLIVQKDEYVWLLKCKPSCWRLYFYVWQERKFIIY